MGFLKLLIWSLSELNNSAPERIKLCREYEIFVTQTIYGVAINKNINEKQPLQSTLTLMRLGKKLTGTHVTYFAPDCYYYIQPGDTIVKYANSAKILIMNNERTKEFLTNSAFCKKDN